jgi:hypothetical protein
LDPAKGNQELCEHRPKQNENMATEKETKIELTSIPLRQDTLSLKRKFTDKLDRQMKSVLTAVEQNPEFRKEFNGELQERRQDIGVAR